MIELACIAGLMKYKWKGNQTDNSFLKVYRFNAEKDDKEPMHREICFVFELTFHKASTSIIKSAWCFVLEPLCREKINIFPLLGKDKYCWQSALIIVFTLLFLPFFCGPRCFLSWHSSTLPMYVDLIIFKKVCNAVLCRISIASDTSDDSGSSLIHEKVGDEKTERKWKLVKIEKTVNIRNKSFAQLCNCE